MLSWVKVTRGDAPLIVSIPHSGDQLAPEMERQLLSRWLARMDTDWHLEKLYDFAPELGATVRAMAETENDEKTRSDLVALAEQYDQRCDDVLESLIVRRMTRRRVRKHKVSGATYADLRRD